MSQETFHVSTRPYSPIDSLNRMAAALGSPRYGQATSHADYNGHHVRVWWNDHNGYYIAEYFWGGRVVLARGTFEQCLAAALEEQNRGALGASVGVYLREGDAEAHAVCETSPDLVAGAAPQEPAWFTWRHECGRRAARDYANPRGSVLIFDWDLMQATETREAYEEAVRAKHGRVYT